MLFFNHNKGGRFFYTPDGTPTGGGGRTGDPGAGQGGGSSVPQGTGSAAPVDPFAGIDFDDLPPEIKAKLTEAKTAFATLQTSGTQSAAQLEQAQRQAREFQSRYDRLAADLQKMQGGQPQQQQQDPQAQLIAQIEGILVKKGVAPDQAKLQAPIHAELLQVRDAALKQEIGTGLQPVVGTMLQNQATTAWQQVVATDRLGAFDLPEVAQAVWDGVQHLINSGQQVTPEIISNLKGMHFSGFLENNPTHQIRNTPVNTPPPTQYPNMATRFTFPGAGAQPHTPAVPDANAARTNLNDDTKAALAQTFSRMGGPTPKAFKK